ncbi:MAG TPA: tetratricopeptide repeat protein [Bacteroidales bacterium]|nr:tetratricopeptide repeat protein [Bacteroidales bacterium]
MKQLSKHVTIIILPVMLMACCNPLFANHPGKTASAVKNDIYTCNLKAAQEKIDAFSSQDPEILAMQYHKWFVDMLFFGLDSKGNVWENHVKKDIEAIEKGDTDQATKHAILSNLLLQDCVVQMTQENQLSAATSFKGGYRHYEALKKINPDHPELLKIQALYEILTGMIPEEFNWLKSLLGLEGNFKAGMRQLKSYLSNCNTKGNYYEAAFYYALFSAYMAEEPDEGRAYYQSELTEHKHSPLFRLGYAILSEATGNTKQGLSVLLENYSDQGDTKLALLDMHIGSFLIYQLKPEGQHYLKRFLSAWPGESYRMQVYNLLYWNSLLHEPENSQKHYAGKILAMAASDKRYADHPVVRELESGISQLKPLLEARLLFNGGLYQRATETLDTGAQEVLQSPHKKHKLEYLYRKARLYTKSEQNSEARAYYLRTIKYGKEETWYYAPQAALKLAEMHEKADDLTKAREYYELCLDINRGEYKRSFERQAKAGLERIKNQT